MSVLPLENRMIGPGCCFVDADVAKEAEVANVVNLNVEVDAANEVDIFVVTVGVATIVDLAVEADPATGVGSFVEVELANRVVFLVFFPAELLFVELFLFFEELRS